MPDMHIPAVVFVLCEWVFPGWYNLCCHMLQTVAIHQYNIGQLLAMPQSMHTMHCHYIKLVKLVSFMYWMWSRVPAAEWQLHIRMSTWHIHQLHQQQNTMLHLPHRLLRMFTFRHHLCGMH